MYQKIATLSSSHLSMFATIGLASGIYLTHNDMGFVCLFILSLALSTFTYFYMHYYNLNSYASIGLVLCSIALGSMRYYQQKNNFNKLYKLSSSPLDCRACVESIEINEESRLPYALTINAYALKINNIWININQTMRIYTYYKPTSLVGDFIELHNLNLKKPKNINFKNYLIKEKIAATFFIPYCKTLLIKRPRFSFKRMLTSYKNNLLSRLEAKFPSNTFTIFSTIFLGKKNKLPADLKQKCKMWGISHYLARSGLHLIMFILIWKALFNFFRYSQQIQSLLLMIVALIYYILSWSSTSFNRAFFTFLLHQLCIATSLPLRSLHLVLAVCFGTLIINPHQLLFLDFQLSFGLAIVIVVYNYIVNQKQPLSYPEAS